MNRLSQLATCVLILSTAELATGAPALGREVYVVRLLTPPPSACGVSGYRDHLIFHNPTDGDQQVIALGASNGYQIPPEPPLVVPAGRTRSIYVEPFGGGGTETNWASGPGYVLLVNKLDVPEAMIVESRGELYSFGGTEMPCGALELLGSFALPVVTALRAPGSRQYHFASDLGTLASRTNVGIFNSEPTPGSATIEVRAACSDRVLETRMVDVAANTLVYVQGFQNTLLNGSCFMGPNAGDYSRYVVVTMDRAGFSFVATRSDNLPPRISLSASTPR